MSAFNKNKDWLLQHSQLHPNGLAAITKSQRLTFTALNGFVENAVKILIGSGIKKSSHCALISNNNLEFIVNVLALWRIGAVPIPLNIRLTNTELVEQINFTECKFVIVHKDLKNKFVFNNQTTIEIPFANSNSAITNGYENNFEGSFNDDDISVMLFTSGSTDKPKAVVFTFKNFINSAIQTSKLIAANENDSWLASLPYYHIGGFMIFVRALVNGNPLILPDSLDLKDILNSIREYNPSIISFVSTQLLRITNENIRPNKNLRAVFLGGGPVENDLIISAKENDWPVIKVYGSTETCSMVSALDLRKEISKIDSAGKAIGENLISINGNAKKGEVIIESESVAKGYYKDPGEKLLNGKFYSSDFGFIDEDGYLFIEGRIDDIIISGGENINTKEIEIALFENSKVKDAFAFGTADKQWGQAAACAVVSGDKSITEENLKKYLISKIASYKIPKKIFFVDEIPKTDLGKVKKEELLKSLNLY